MKFLKDNRIIKKNQFGRKIEQGSAIIADVRADRSIPTVRITSNYSDPRFEVANGSFDYSNYYYLADDSYPSDRQHNKYVNPITADIQRYRIRQIENKICR